MASLTSYFESNFSNLREQWEKTLQKELKLTEVGTKTSKKQLDGSRWPILSVETKSEVQLASSQWKKASNSYAVLEESAIEELLNEDLKGGVRNFFFEGSSLTPAKWKKIETVLEKHVPTNELEVFILGKGSNSYQSKSFKVISTLISGKEFHDQGAHSIQELALLAKNLVNNLDQVTDEVYLGVYVDSHFFHNIAKIRAAKLLALKILSEASKTSQIKIVALTSYEGWTIFERYSNMLRNETAVASAFIGGADHVQSSGYSTLLEIETENGVDQEHSERSRRMARNTSHVLALESMLGVVEDAAFGSYHLENLTEHLCQEAWKTMQDLLSGKDLTNEITKVREEKLQMIKSRKMILSGTNDFPDVKEHLKLKLKPSPFFRVGRIFEELRLKMDELSNKPKVYIALYGEYASLSARVNFIKNYFELLGLTVIDPGHSELNFKKIAPEHNEDIVVLCSSDENYPELMDVAQSIKSSHKYIAGKFEMQGFKNLYSGQNVYEVLQNLVESFSGRKS